MMGIILACPNPQIVKGTFGPSPMPPMTVDAPLSSLIDSTLNPNVKTTKG